MIKIFDTSLRDGEQSPGCSMNLQEKIQVARQLERLNVDVIEAGFAVASQGDFDAVEAVAREVKFASVASLSRARKEDIDVAWQALRKAERPMIHTFLATSDIHLKHKLKISRIQCKEMAEDAIRHAKTYCPWVEFSCEDASRTDEDFLIEMVELAIRAGATTVNIPDTVGYSEPFEFYQLIKNIMDKVEGIDEIDLSVHCHNDLGMATANSLAAVRAGASQLECTINGIGERAGNCALEEVTMALHTRKDIYGLETGINIKEIVRSSRLIQNITGNKLQANKAIVGINAFRHESGIHQHGILEEKSTYEIMTPESIGLYENKLVLGKHSGKHALKEKINELGYEVTDENLGEIFIQFKNLADDKKEIFDEDIEALMLGEMSDLKSGYSLVDYQTITIQDRDSKTIIKLEKDGSQKEVVGTGKGPIDSAFDGLAKLFNGEFTLEDFKIQAVSEGKDALGETMIVLAKDEKKYSGKGLSNDIIKSSIKAYINAINKIEYFLDKKKS